MRVLVDPSLFTSNRVPELFSLLWLGLVGRHRILVEQHDTESYRSFLESLDQALRDEWEMVIEYCESLDAKEPSVHEIRVALVRDSAWSQIPPRINFEDALTLLTAPYRLLVEDGISDRDFVLALCSQHQRSFLK